MGDRNETATPPRRYPRVGLPRGPLIAWRGSSGLSVGTITTVSLGGLFISTDEPAEAGSTLKLLFDAPGGEIRARANVRYIVPGQGMGVQFVNMSYEDRARLHQLLSRLLKYE
ncbi:MAG: PilZ domain-containing protein [Terriglobales bacterium]